MTKIKQQKLFKILCYIDSTLMCVGLIGVFVSGIIGGVLVTGLIISVLGGWILMLANSRGFGR